MQAHIYPVANKNGKFDVNGVDVEAQFNAVELNNRGLAATRDGRHQEAEKLYRRALRLKEKAQGPNSIAYALSANALGECLNNQRRWDEAITYLQNALTIRESGPLLNTDAAATRDNLGRAYEGKGDLEMAREIRSRNREAMMCSHYECPNTMALKWSQIKRCSRCQAAFYCCEKCQRADWSKRHKEFCKKPKAATNAKNTENETAATSA